nr:hypothetical protein [uncultured Rhodopila sp.]
MTWNTFLAMAGTLLVGATAALPMSAAMAADSIADCQGILIRDVIQSSSKLRLDWRLSQYIDQKTYDELKKDSGGSVSYQGFFLGSNYGEFQKHLQENKQQTNESLTFEQANNIFWTGMSHLQNFAAKTRDFLAETLPESEFR